MRYTINKLESVNADNETIHVFIDRYGHTIAQAVGKSSYDAVRRHLDGKTA